MTNLHMKQKVFSWRASFTIRDGNGEDRYRVKGDYVFLGSRLHVYDLLGTEAAMIQRKPFSLRPRFQVFIGGIMVAEIVKELTLFHPHYVINGVNWSIKGDFWAHKYSICSSGETIVRVFKEWLSWGDCYTIEITHDEDTILALAVVLAIDCVIAQQAVVAST